MPRPLPSPHHATPSLQPAQVTMLASALLLPLPDFPSRRSLPTLKAPSLPSRLQRQAPAQPPNSLPSPAGDPSASAPLLPLPDFRLPAAALPPAMPSPF